MTILYRFSLLNHSHFLGNSVASSFDSLSKKDCAAISLLYLLSLKNIPVLGYLYFFLHYKNLNLIEIKIFL